MCLGRKLLHCHAQSNSGSHFWLPCIMHMDASGTGEAAAVILSGCHGCQAAAPRRNNTAHVQIITGPDFMCLHVLQLPHWDELVGSHLHTSPGGLAGASALLLLFGALYNLHGTVQVSRALMSQSHCTLLCWHWLKCRGKWAEECQWAC